MNSILKLEDLSFQNFFNGQDFNYELTIEDDDTVADVIFNYLFRSNDTIQLKSKEGYTPEVERFYKEKLERQITKGAPIDFFLTTFSPKFKFEEQTNFYIHPDMSDLFTLIHLQKIAKKIREVYPYNFRFFIVFKGDSYKNLGSWTNSELTKTFTYLKKLNEKAEMITKVKNSIVLIRWEEFMGGYADYFKDVLYQTAKSFYTDWSQNKEPEYSQIEKWKKDFGKHMHSNHKDPFFTEFFTKEACKVKALNHLIFKEGEFLEIISGNNPNLMLAHTRKNTKFFSLNLNPKFRNFSHFFLTTFENGEWLLKKWKDIESGNYKPIYFEGFEYPLYFEKQE